MTLVEALLSNKPEKSIALAKAIATELNITWDGEAETVFKVIANNTGLAPKIGGRNDSSQLCIRKWLLKFQKGYEGRPSIRKSNPIGTISDPIIDTMIKSRLTQLENKQIIEIISAHQLAMSAENILGPILEEYLATNLLQSQWACAWGSTVKSVDFVHSDGQLLQIKNRSNSENSSSSSVRIGTVIKKWYRINATSGETYWERLDTDFGIDGLTEKSFIEFVKNCIKNNPDCLAVDNDSPWKIN